MLNRQVIRIVSFKHLVQLHQSLVVEAAHDLDLVDQGLFAPGLARHGLLGKRLYRNSFFVLKPFSEVYLNIFKSTVAEFPLPIFLKGL